ncbi:MAG: hypothetical protein ACE5GS_16575 [Kiloniellaceae bacterium]
MAFERPAVIFNDRWYKFRAQMVEPVRAGHTPEGLSREFEPSAQAIRNRVSQLDRDEGRNTSP